MRASKGSAAVALLFSLLVAVAATPAVAQSGGVFVVGDSLEVGTAPYLPRYLPDLAVRVDADESRSSCAAAEVVRARTMPSDAVVVLDVGSNNDPSRPERQLADLGDAPTPPPSRAYSMATGSMQRRPATTSARS